MNRRTIALLLLSYLIVMFYLLSNRQKNVPEAQNVAQKNDIAQQLEDALPGQDNPDGGTDLDGAPLQAAEKGESEPDEEIEAKTEAQPFFHTVGSLDPQSGSRYLITVNPVGGTIRRVELNFHDARRDRFKYRDLENTAGYLGCLDCLDTPEGCLIRTVGHGTPAFNAKSSDVEGGLRVGDLILALDGEPINTKELETRLGSTQDEAKPKDGPKPLKPETVINLTVLRRAEEGQKTIQFSAELTHKPIELLRPEVNEFLPDVEFPESFQLGLLQPKSQHEQIWPDLDDRITQSVWDVKTISDREIELSYNLNAGKLAKLGFEKLRVVKRYRLPEISEQDLYNLDSRTFHFELDVEIINDSDKAQEVAYQLDGPTGSTTETWWYTHKIHGRTSALFATAGARDVVGSTQYQPFIFYGCPEIATAAVAFPPAAKFVCNPHANEAKARQLNFVGVDTQYFNVSLIPQTQNGQPFEVNSVTAFPNGPVNPKTTYQRLTDCTFQLFKSAEIGAGQTYRQTFDLFAGPKDRKLLAHYASAGGNGQLAWSIDDTRTFGWFGWLSRPLLSLLHFFYWITGSFSYGIAIVLLTMLVRSLMIPISRKAALNAQMMTYLQPQMTEIREKYKDTPEKQGIATRELFRKYKYNPLSGCFLGLLQLPIFLGLYRGLSVDIGLRDQPLIPGMRWCSNLSAPDQFLNWESWMPAFLSDKMGYFGPYLNILPLVTVVLFLMQQKMFMPPPTDDQQRMMQKMLTVMMVFMGFLFFKVAAGLCIYFITSSLWGILERKLLPKPELNTEKLTRVGSGEKKSPDSNVEGTGFLARAKALHAKAQAAASKKNGSVDKVADRKQINADRKKRLKNREQ